MENKEYLRKVYQKKCGTIPYFEFDDVYNDLYIKLSRVKSKREVRDVRAYLTTSLINLTRRKLSVISRQDRHKNLTTDFKFVDFNSPENIKMQSELLDQALLKVDKSKLSPKTKLIARTMLKYGSAADAARHLGLSRNLVKVTWHDVIRHIFDRPEYFSMNYYGLSPDLEGSRDVRLYSVIKGQN
jgi:DNA-directed RNA polymerase specialized sigma24 family protein